MIERGGRMDLIDRNKVIKIIQDAKYFLDGEAYHELSEVLYNVEQLPTVDAVLVVHGNWIKTGSFVKCSECDEYMEESRKTNFCPRCGAKMNGKKVE